MSAEESSAPIPPASGKEGAIERAYWCFISYRHLDNEEPGREWASWLHHRLETFHVPEDLVGRVNDREETIPAQIFPVFRDEEELAGGHLKENIRKALRHAKSMVVICSPRATESPYVDEEIQTYKKLRDQELAAGENPVRTEPLIAVIDGDPEAPASSANACFPKAVLHRLDERGQITEASAPESLWIDFRLPDKTEGWTSSGAFRSALEHDAGTSKSDREAKVEAYALRRETALLRILAGILGVSLGELQKRDQAYRLAQAQNRARILHRWLVAVASLALIAVTGGWLAVQGRREANRQRDEARFNESLGWMLRAEVADRADRRIYPHNLFFAARAIGFDGWGQAGEKPTWLGPLAKWLPWDRPRDNGFIRLVGPHKPEYDRARKWIENRPAFLPCWLDSDVGSGLTGIAVTLDGRRIVAGTKDGRIVVWDLATGRRREGRGGSGSSSISGMSLHPGGHHVALGVGAQVETWRLEGLERESSTRTSTDVTALAYGPDGEALALGLADGSIELWKDNVPVLILPGHDGPVRGLVFHSDRITLASSGGRGPAKLWYLPGKFEGTTLEAVDSETTAQVQAIALGPDGSLLATGERDGTIRLWDATTGELVSDLAHHDAAVRCLVFSPDGVHLFSGAEDGEARIWNLARPIQPQLVATLKGAGGALNAIGLGPLGEILACATESGEVVLWRVGGGENAATPDLLRYFTTGWYAFEPGGDAVWKGGGQNAALNLDPQSLPGLYRSELSTPDRERRIFDRLVEQGNWDAAGVLLERLPKNQDQSEIVGRLLDDAGKAIAGYRFRVAEDRIELARTLESAMATDRIDQLQKELERRSRREEGHPFVNDEGMEMVWIGPGAFLMGSPEDEAGRRYRQGDDVERQHRRVLTNGFWMARTEVTGKQWVHVMGERRNRSRFRNVEGWESHPVETVSWEDAMNFCRQLTAREMSKGGLPDGFAYTLPSEAQWEYACRAGSSGPVNVVGAAFGELAWYTENSGRQSHPVGLKAPNAFGLFDMQGNVWEWTSDIFQIYPGNPPPDYVETRIGAFRVVRGGGWNSSAAYGRSAARFGQSPDTTLQDIGFRPVVTRAD